MYNTHIDYCPASLKLGIWHTNRMVVSAYEEPNIGVFMCEFPRQPTREKVLNLATIDAYVFNHLRTPNETLCLFGSSLGIQS